MRTVHSYPSVNFSFPTVKKTRVFPSSGENRSFLNSWKTKVNSTILTLVIKGCEEKKRPKWLKRNKNNKNIGLLLTGFCLVEASKNRTVMQVFFSCFL